MSKIKKNRLINLAALTLVMSGMTLSACATKSDRRGPPPDRQGGERSQKTSGTFLQPVGGLFLAMDADGDKVVSKAEAQFGIQKEYDTFDTRPSATFFANWSIASLGSTDAMPTFMSFDRDFNGIVSEREFSSQLERDFDRLDKNQDGNLERSEMLIAFEAPRGRDRQEGGGRDNKQKKGGGGGRPSR